MDTKEMESIGAFPELITNLVRARPTDDPLLRAYKHLPLEHQQTVKRKLEHAIHEETLSMDEQARTKFFKSVSSNPESKVIELNIHCIALYRALKHVDLDCHCHEKHVVFSDEAAAAQSLLNWIRANKLILVKCTYHDFVLCRSESNRPHVTTFETCLDIVRTEKSIGTESVSHVECISFGAKKIDVNIDNVDLPIQNEQDDESDDES